MFDLNQEFTISNAKFKIAQNSYKCNELLMITGILQNLGYQVGTKLSQIQSWENIRLSKEHSYIGKKFDRVDFGFRILRFTVKKILEKDQESPLSENLYYKGFEYARAKIDPTIQEVWLSIIENPVNKAYRRNTNKLIQSLTHKPDKKKILTDQITSFFHKVIYGGILFDYIPELDIVAATVHQNETYFEKNYNKKPLGDDFSKDVSTLTILNKLGYDAFTTIKDMVKENELIENLQHEFLDIETPDLKRTINDRIETINEKLKPGHRLIGVPNFYHEGNLIAIRGECPLLLKLLKDNSSYVHYNPWTFDFTSDNYLGKDSLLNAKSILERIAIGYSYLYHLTYLESHLLEQENGNANSTLTKQTNQLDTKLKWQGQKNQFYDILRQLKNKSLLSNSYEELAVFLKQHVDIFNNTSLSTIQKEIGKDKRPTKNKRVDIDL